MKKINYLTGLILFRRFYRQHPKKKSTGGKTNGRGKKRMNWYEPKTRLDDRWPILKSQYAINQLEMWAERLPF